MRGSRSNWTRVKSGVPQGTILGPILFLVYINDLPSEIQSPIKLFADDTKLCRKLVNRVTDANILQSDLNKIETWSDIWQLKFNCEKCETMRITHAKDFSKPEYYMSNKKLQVVGEVKDLGITITHHLTWGNPSI